MTLRVLVVSDVRIVQEGVRHVLDQLAGVNVVGTVDTPRATPEIARLHPQVVLFDATRHDNVAFVRGLVVSAPQSKVVAFGVRESAEELLALAAAGTAGYVGHSAAGSDVVRVLERVMCDELPCSPRAAATLYRYVAALSHAADESVGIGNNGTGGSNGSGHAGTVSLSRRELQIAQLIDCGLTNKEIGRQLGIEAATVKNHVHNLCEKLKVHRRGEAAAWIRALARTREPSAATAPDVNRAPEERLNHQNSPAPSGRVWSPADQLWTDVGQ